MNLDGTSVRTLRLRGAVPRSPVAKLASTAVLSHASLEPPDLPKSSILVVRALRYTLPERWTPSAGATLPSPSWYRGLAQTMREVSSRAARPDRGRLPSSPEAVLFADESEMLACWWLDVADHRAGARWYWPVLFGPRAFTMSTVVARLAERAPRFPATFEALDEWGEALRVARTLDASDARRLAVAVSRAHGSFELAKAFGSNEIAATFASRAREELPPLLAAPPQPRWGRAAATRWRGQGVEDAVLALLVLSEALAAPRARSELAVLRTIAEVLSTPRSRARSAEVLAPLQTLARPAERGRMQQREVSAPKSAAITDREEAEARFAASLPPSARGDLAPALADEEAPSRRAGSEVRGNPERVLASSSALAPGKDEAPANLARTGEGARLTVPSPAADHERTDRDDSDDVELTERSFEPLARGVETSFGGVFYLINVIERMELDRSWAAWRLEEQLGAWGILDAVARGLATAGGCWAPDPLWAILARLSDRSPSSVLGAELVEPVGSEGADAVESAAPGVPVSASLERWLKLALPSVIERLRSALEVRGVEEVASELMRPACVEVSRTHVDVIFSLDSISLRVRRAGLDRNPGWCPALRRVVSFHFVRGVDGV